MQLEELTKTQIVLLTLLTSFVTSIATGITTVTLMDQAPPGVTQTINRVVERTVEVIVPEKTQGAAVSKTVIVREEDFIVDATKTNAPNLVEVAVVFGESTSQHSGFVVSADGVVVTNKLSLGAKDSASFTVKTREGDVYDARVLPIVDSRLTFLKLDQTSDSEEREVLFAKPTFAKDDAINLGQTAVALGVNDSTSVLVGVVSRLEEEKKETASTTPSGARLYAIHTTLPNDTAYLGGPLVGTNTDVLGIAVSSKESGLVAIPASVIAQKLNTYRESLLKENDEG